MNKKYNDSKEIWAELMHSFKEGSLAKYTRLRRWIINESNLKWMKNKIIIMKSLWI